MVRLDVVVEATRGGRAAEMVVVPTGQTASRGSATNTRLRAMILALAAFALVPLGAPANAQRTQTETIFVQGSEAHPARILHERVALVLSEDVLANPDRYAELLESLGGKPISTLPPYVIEIAAPDLDDATSLKAFAAELVASLPEVVVDSGLLVTIGQSELPFVLTDKIIVQIEESDDPDLIRKVAEEFDAEILGGNPFEPRQFVITLSASDRRDALQVSNAINRFPGVRFAHPNFYRPVEQRQTPVIPNDEFFANQWHLNNTGQSGGTVDADIDADRAWSFGLGSADIIVAVVDEGFEANHPDLAGGLWSNPGEAPGNGIDDDGNGFIDDIEGWDFTGCVGPVPCGDDDVSPMGGQSHGTAVAGAALARSNNVVGVSGTCPRCTFLPIRAANPVYALGLAIGYAQAMGADVISNSWGFPIGSPMAANVVTAVNNAAAAGRGGLGSVVLFGMSNQSFDNCSGIFPDISSLPNVIAVSRATNQDRFYSGGFGTCMDVLAPTAGGTLSAVTTDRQGTSGYNNSDPFVSCLSVEPAPPPDSNHSYTFCFEGTSFATPVTAGVAGLVLSHDSTLTRLQVQRLLQDTADKISDSAGEYSEQTGFSAPASGAPPTHGYGRINAFEAVRTVADRADGGRGGVDIYLRDNRLDWGNTEQLSNVTFEQTRGFIPHWRSVDIKVDAPPYQATSPATSVEFDAFVHENPLSNTLNRVYVRVHNRGTRAATDVTVKLHWAFAGAGLPALPADFWPAFPSDSTDVSTWHPIPTQTIASLPYSGASLAGGVDDGSAVLTFDFNAPAFDPSLPNPDHYCLFAIVDAPDDPVSETATGSLVPDYITPRDNNVTHRNIQLLDSGQSGRLDARLVLSNPFEHPIETRLVARLPKGWRFGVIGSEGEQTLKLAPGKSVPAEITILPGDERPAMVDVVQLYRGPGMEDEEPLGGMTYDVAPRKISLRPEIVGLIHKHQALIGEYQGLVADALSRQRFSSDDRMLLDRVGRLLEDQSRLLLNMEELRGQ